MKKLIAISTLFALTVAGVSEAKGFRSSGFRSASSSRAVATKPVQKQTQNQNTQDATFANTPNRNIPNGAQAQAGGNRMASFATGAAAGYLLSSALAPTEAQANEQVAGQSASQAVGNAQNVANTVSSVAEFRSIGGQIDPYLVEKTDGYRRYCIEGVQYLAPAQGGQSTPIVMVTPNGAPLACQLVQ